MLAATPPTVVLDASPDLPLNLPLSTGHHGTARNVTGHDVVDVAGFPEWCWALGESSSCVGATLGGALVQVRTQY